MRVRLLRYKYYVLAGKRTSNLLVAELPELLSVL